MTVFTSSVIKGKGRGTELGFPTFNLVIPAHFTAPEGIYAADVIINGRQYRGALHWGPIPVFNEDEKSLEIFVLDYPDTDAPRTIRFELKTYLRPIKNFDSPAALTAQIKKDIIHIRRL